MREYPDRTDLRIATQAYYERRWFELCRILNKLFTTRKHQFQLNNNPNSHWPLDIAGSILPDIISESHHVAKRAC